MPTFQDILARMIDNLQKAGSRLTDFTQTSVIYQIYSAIAAVIDQIYYAIQSAQKQAYISTATKDGLDNKGHDLGVQRKQAQAAEWLFYFTKKQVSSQEITIPAGTVITTIPQQGEELLTFVTKEKASLPAGTLSVGVMATCQIVGQKGNIGVNVPLLIGSTVNGIDGVITPSKQMEGTYGIDEEGDDDYRARLLAAMASKAQGTISWYEQTALSVPGVTFVNVVKSKEYVGVIEIYIVGPNNNVTDQTLLNKVQSVIDAGRIITDAPQVFYPKGSDVKVALTIQVAQHYDAQQTSENVVDAVKKYINSLGIGGGPLGTLYQSQINAIALEVPGVINVVAQTPPPPDVKFSAYELPQAADVIVTVALQEE